MLIERERRKSVHIFFLFLFYLISFWIDTNILQFAVGLFMLFLFA